MFRKFLLIALGLSLLTFSSVTCSGDDDDTAGNDDDAVDDDDIGDDDDTDDGDTTDDDDVMDDDDDDTGDDDEGDGEITEKIGSEGGSILIETEYGKVEVNIPPDALEEEATITVREAKKDELPEIPESFSMEGPGIILEPTGLEFSKPVTILFPIPSDFADSGTFIASYNSETQTWDVPAIIEASSKSVTIATMHFSFFSNLVGKFTKDEYHTEFDLNIDGFPVENTTENFQSTSASEGACWGIVSFAKWYYENKREIRPLFTAYDVYTAVDIAVEALDVQKSIAEKTVLLATHLLSGLSNADSLTANALKNSMILTGKPQLLGYAESWLGGNMHAVLVVGWDSTGFYIYDPNDLDGFKKMGFDGFFFEPYNEVIGKYTAFTYLGAQGIISRKAMEKIYHKYPYASVCPDEKDCAGLECGPDPVCGESCGECSEGEVCNEGICEPGTYDDDDVTDDDDDVTDDDDDDNITDDDDDDTVVSADLTWISIPAGSFEMGCSPGDSDCDSDEEPRHTVNVSVFEMTETEITQSQYEEVTGETPSYFESCPDCPVDHINWYQAKEFCEGIGGRLPSEAEWEYAARAGTTTQYYCGDDESCLDDIAWYDGNSDVKTHPVGQKDANDFGLYDMLGNVWEWTEDCWHENYDGAPNNGGVWTGGECDYRVLRGGSWGSLNTPSLRASNRGGSGPDDGDVDVGFRCAR